MRTSLLTDITEQNNSTLEDSFYDNWRRQKKFYKTKIKTLNEKLNQMQEKLDILQQKQLQRDLSRGRNSINKSKFNKFDHINMETVSGFCKNKMFPVYKFLDHSMLIYSSNKQSLCAKHTGLIGIPRESNTPTDYEFYWTNNIMPMINGKYIEIRSNFNTEVKKVYLGKLHIFLFMLIKMDSLTYSCNSQLKHQPNWLMGMRMNYDTQPRMSRA
jgi:hypothetical protein